MTAKEEEQLKFRIALTLIPNVGSVLAKSLVSYCGSVEKIFREKQHALIKIPGVGEVVAQSIREFNDFERAEKEIEFIIKYKITPMFYTDKSYPQRLRNCSDSPVMLFYKGEADLNQQRFVAFVGTRKATEYGKIQTEKIIEHLKLYNVTIISGLAYGIDICAHKAALKNDIPTVAVLAHGLDRIYPGSHRSIAEKMLHNGGLLTEYLSNTNPDRENFPTRNRIVAGISDATVVIEAAETGGALITAEMANNYNRDVFALPGRADDYYSKGCNRIIKTNKAALIENADDIVYQLGWQNTEVKKKNKQRELFVELTDDERTIFQKLNAGSSVGIDTICLESNLNTSKVAATLLALEFKGLIKALPGKMYQAI